MTTVPLSVCYGALNLLVLADTSNFVPYVCDRAIPGSMRARKAPYRHPLFPVVAWQRKGCTVLGGLSHLSFPVWVRLTLGPNTCFISFNSIIVPIPWFLCPLFVPSFVSQEKKSARCCSFESLSDSGFIAQNLAFYRPNKTRTDILLANKRIT